MSQHENIKQIYHYEEDAGDKLFNEYSEPLYAY